MTTVNGQDVQTGDIDDGRPERISVLCSCLRFAPSDQPTLGIPRHDCDICRGYGFRDETDAEYWERVENMSPNSADDLI